MKKNHPHHQNFEISFHRFFCFLYKHEQQRPQHSSLCIYFVSSVQRYYSDLQERKKNYLNSVPPSFSRIIFNFLLAVSFFLLRTDYNTTAPHIILIFVLEKNSIFVRIIWKLIS